ncbi:hypothetical protein M569_13259 [Genlisea aurea]|uniref:Bifunctional inhibitor/plant lipid transfer protein/seed storage helical domain-containing protein n=1 Tax=Genlisea aurea TaxID=192259 RepID=S8DFG7_9LAMI|nr:hypothetical protein M569_13259 [Genlisea aurea]
MAKLVILVASLAAMYLLAAAAATTTTVVISTAADGDENQRCEERGREMRQCMEFMRMMPRGGRRVMGMMEGCCEELRDVEPECRCDEIRRMMRMMEMEGEEAMMMEKAERLPKMCGFEYPRRCRMTAAASLV